MRVSAIVPDRPALLPAVKLNCNDALLQLAKFTVTDPTGGDAGAGFVG